MGVATRGAALPGDDAVAHLHLGPGAVDCTSTTENLSRISTTRPVPTSSSSSPEHLAGDRMDDGDLVPAQAHDRRRFTPSIAARSMMIRVVSTQTT